MNKNTKYLKKYHFRRYKRSNLHPFLVVLVNVDPNYKKRIYFSGFNLTRSSKIAKKRSNKYIRIINPNPSDDLDCFLCIDPIINKPIYLFKGPLVNWRLSPKDKKRIDKLVRIKIKTPRRS